MDNAWAWIAISLYILGAYNTWTMLMLLDETRPALKKRSPLRWHHMSIMLMLWPVFTGFVLGTLVASAWHSKRS